MLTLSHRLQTICDMVTPGLRVCDVGCDHAYVDIRLLQEDKVPSALAMDVADGPLAIAASNLNLTELSDRCEVRKSNGLAAYHSGEADCMICAGMGGILMRSLLAAEPEKVSSFRELILSPQSEIYLVREWLFAGNYRITEERFLEDEGKYYTVMKILCPGQDAAPCLTDQAKQAESAEQAGQEKSTEREAWKQEETELPAQLRPDWEGLLEWIHLLPDETLDKALVHRKEMERILSDPGFRKLSEEMYGPCILYHFLEEGKEPVFQKFLMENLRSRLVIIRELSRAAADAGGGSENAGKRLQEIRGETGTLQVLLAINMLRQIEGRENGRRME